MVWICRRRILLERLMVRHVIRRGNARAARVPRATNRLPVSISRSRRKSPAEVSPTESFGVQQVTDIPTGHNYLSVLPKSPHRPNSRGLHSSESADVPSAAARAADDADGR